MLSRLVSEESSVNRWDKPAMVWYAALLVCLLRTGIMCAKYDHKTGLMRDLFQNYSSEVRPVLDTSHVTTVNVTFHLRMIHQLEQTREKFVTSGWFTFVWFDELLRWDPADYGNLSSVVTSGVWKPDVHIYNGYGEFLDLTTNTVSSMVYSDGKVVWSPANSINTHCDVDITFYPFDTQECTIQIVTWVSTDKEVDLRHSMNTLPLEGFITNAEWEIKETSTTKRAYTFKQYEGRYPCLVFSYTLVRRRMFFVLTVLVPVICESALCSLVFLVPSESGERLSLSITVLLSYAVFLAGTTASLPSSSIGVSIMSLYLLFVLILGTLTVVLTGISLYIYHSPVPFSLPSRSFRKLRKKCSHGTEQAAKVIPPSDDFNVPNDFSTCLPGLFRTPQEDPKLQSLKFDRICLWLTLSLSLTAVVCLILALTWHDGD